MLLKNVLKIKVVTVQRQFRLAFNLESACKKSIKNNVAKYQNFVTRLNKNKRNSGRSRSAANDKNIESMDAIAKVSTRRSGLDVFASSFNHITRNELKWHLGQIRVAHHLTEILKHN